MDEATRGRYASMIATMVMDYKMGGITWETFKSNLKIVCDQIEETGPGKTHDRGNGA